MMKMEIKLDEDRVKRDGRFDIAELWQAIDKEFANACTKEVQPDGSVMYVGIPNKDYYSDINVAATVYKNTEWFAQYCVKWIWYDNDDDESLPFQDIDVLASQRAKNPLFKRWS